MDAKTMSLEEGNQAAAAVAKAPRVTLADIEGAVKRANTFVAGRALNALGFDYSEEGGPEDLMTIAVVTLHNGFVIIGKSACASPENFNAELGATLAYEDAVRQIWPLMGFALRDRLHNEGGK